MSTTHHLSEATLDLVGRRVLRADGATVELTEQEAALLAYLAENAGEVVTREALLEQVLGYSRRAQTRAADHAIARLRAKIEVDPTSPRMVLTVHGVGYRLVLATAEIAPPPRPAGRTIAFGPVRVDVEGRVALRDGVATPLTEAEVALLAALDEAQGRTVERHDLARKVRGRGDTRALDHLVHRLRAKLEPRPDEPVWLLTDRGRGYRLAKEWAAPRRWRPADLFVGRGAERASVRELLDRARLVTLVGPGGIGKSRLAAEVAEAHPGGVWHADLADARDVSGVCAAVARALDLSIAGSEPVAPLGVALANRGRALLVIDDAEPAIDALAATVGRWLDEAPELTVLATSRQVTGLRGEHVFAVPPLDLSDTDDASATALFVARARAARAGFEVGPDAGVIAALVRRLDGLPLAIELAAARVRVMAPAEILARLDRPLALLAGPAGAARQATMRGAIAASWALLSPEQRSACARLSVFRGGFGLDAAEAVLGGAFPVDVLQALVERSLVVVQATEGGTRYRMYDAIREFGLEQLAETDPAGEGERAHGRHFARFGQHDAIAALNGHGGPSLRAARIADEANLVAALDRALRRGDADVVGPIACLLAELWFAVGRAREVERILDQALPVVLGGPWHPWLARRRGLVAWMLGRADEAVERWEAAARAFAASGEAEGELLCRTHLAMMAENQGRFDAARSGYETALSEARARGFVRLEAMISGNLAIVDHDQGRVEQAREGYARAAAMFAELGDVRFEAMNRGNLALLHREQGRLSLASAGYRQVIAMYRALGDRRAEGLIAVNASHVDRALGNVAEAEAALVRALANARAIGNVHVEGLALGGLAHLHLDQGRHDEALAGFERSLALLEGSGARLQAAVISVNRSRLQRALGRADAARSGADAAIAALDALGEPRFAAQARVYRADLRREQGDLGGARADLRAAGVDAFADPSLRAEAASVRALLALAEGLPDEASACLALVEGLAEGAAPQSDLGMSLTALRAALAPASR